MRLKVYWDFTCFFGQPTGHISSRVFRIFLEALLVEINQRYIFILLKNFIAA